MLGREPRWEESQPPDLWTEKEGGPQDALPRAPLPVGGWRNFYHMRELESDKGYLPRGQLASGHPANRQRAPCTGDAGSPCSWEAGVSLRVTACSADTPGPLFKAPSRRVGRGVAR